MTTITRSRQPREGWPDEAFLRSAIDEANPGALRMALYQQTGDPELAAMTVEQRPLRGGSMVMPSISREARTILRDKAFAYLSQGPAPAAPAPDLAQTEQLIAVFGAPAATPMQARMAFEELGFDPSARDVAWTKQPSAGRLAAFKVTVVGAGVSGLAAAIKLKKLGIPFEIIERQGAVGGTWALNDYPEARVDVSNFLYQFKFEQNYPWRGAFATQAEIREYLEHIARKYGVFEHIRLSTALAAADWNEAAKRWDIQLRLPDGQVERTSSQVVLSAAGLFSTARIPDIPGLDSFRGRMFHTTAWDHTYDLKGKRVALIGTGSSGAQLMPHLARTAQTLSVFQRTPNWILPINGYHAAVSEGQRWMLANLPYYWNWFCYATVVLDQQLEDLQERDPEWQAAGGEVSQRNDQLRAFLEAWTREQLADRPDLLAKSLPTFPPAARRLVADNGWFDALKRPNVELVTDPIARITPDGVVTAGGHDHKVDLIVLGSGFNTAQYLLPAEYRGVDGRTPQAQWAKDGARAYLGMTVPGFPNFFIFYGPNGQPRTGSFPSWSEVWARYAISLVAAMIERGGEAIEVKEDAFAAYNDRMDAAMERLIWGSPGAGSYYVNAHGRSSVNMPWNIETYFGQVLAPDLENYEIR